MKTKNKIIYIICEGVSDDVTIHHALVNYIKSISSNFSTNIHVEVTDGDLAYKDGINLRNCGAYVKNKVDEFKTKMYLFNSDFLAIIHILDTDGSFIDSDSIIEDKSIKFAQFIDNKLHTPKLENTKKRFEKRTNIYKKLLEIEHINKIKYYKFFFSRNLEHALYNIPYATIYEKKQLSNSFDEKYAKDVVGFKKIMKEILFAIPNNYEYSWKYIFKNNNSLKRGSNFYLIFDKIDEIIKQR